MLCVSSPFVFFYSTGGQVRRTTEKKPSDAFGTFCPSLAGRSGLSRVWELGVWLKYSGKL